MVFRHTCVETDTDIEPGEVCRSGGAPPHPLRAGTWVMMGNLPLFRYSDAYYRALAIKQPAVRW